MVDLLTREHGLLLSWNQALISNGPLLKNHAFIAIAKTVGNGMILIGPQALDCGQLRLNGLASQDG